MKKLSVSLIVMLLATVACANEVDILLKDEGSGVLGVYYDVDEGASTSVPVAYSLTIVTTDGVMVEPCDVIYTDPCYPVFIDFAHDAVGPDFDPADWNPADPCYEIGDGNPMANPNAAGVPTAEAASFSICMGRLDENQVAGPVDETCLVKIQLTQGSAADTDVTVAADTLRGGVVGSTFVVTPVYEDGSFTTVLFDEPCFDSSHPKYAEWVAMGEPPCWCNKYQCFGDANGAQGGNPITGFSWVENDDLTILVASWKKNVGEAGFNICADFNRAQGGNPITGFYRVENDDLTILVANWKDDSGLSMTCGGSN